MATFHLPIVAAAGFAFIIISLFSGCAVTGDYPDEWPKLAPQKMIGKCPDISGKYKNLKVENPYFDSTPMPITLAQTLGLSDGDHVEIWQSPEVIKVTVRNYGSEVEAVAFTSGEVGIGWEKNRRHVFLCPYDIPSGRVIYFSHQGQSSIGGNQGIFAAQWEGVSYYKAVDGSLVVKFTKGLGGVIAPFPFGKVDRIWYRFESFE